MARAFYRWTEVRNAASKAVFGPGPGRVEVDKYLFPIVLVVIWQHIRARHTNHFQAIDPRHLLLIAEVRVPELLEPGEVIEHRMVDAVIPRRPNIGGRHAQVLQEHGVVGPAAQVPYRHIHTGGRGRWPV